MYTESYAVIISILGLKQFFKKSTALVTCVNKFKCSVSAKSKSEFLAVTWRYIIILSQQQTLAGTVRYIPLPQLSKETVV